MHLEVTIFWLLLTEAAVLGGGLEGPQHGQPG